MRSVLSADSFAKLAVHVGELNSLLQDILRDGMALGYIPAADIESLAQLIHGSLTASATRGAGQPNGADLDEHIAGTVRFIQAGVGAVFDDDGRPARLPASR